MTKEANITGEGFADEVGSLFEMWAWADERECLAADLEEHGAEEMARQFRQAEDLLEGLESTAEQAVGFGAYIVFGDAKSTPPGRERSQKATRERRARHERGGES